MIGLLKKWWILIAFGWLFLFATYGLRQVSNSALGDEPIVLSDGDPISQYVRLSPKAKAYVESYFQREKTRQIQPKHFQHLSSVVCGIAFDELGENSAVTQVASFESCIALRKKVFFRNNLPD